MDKRLSKAILLENNIPTPRYVQTLAELPKLQFPIVRKPHSEGSSRGVDVFSSLTDCEGLLEDGNYFYEEFIEGQEVTIGILDGHEELIVLPILELVPKKDFYDFEAKYTKGMTEFVIPARLNDQRQKQCQDFARKVHLLLGCTGVSRIDIRVHPEKGPFILELNTIPGMTELSDVPAQAKAAGYRFSELIVKILEMAWSKK